MHITDTLPGEKRARLVFGLDWRAYSSKGKSGERKRYADNFSASHYVEMEAGEVVNGGFCALDEDDLKGAVLFSGAARVASLDSVKDKPAVLVLMPDSERVYLVYVVQGSVHHDEVLKPEELSKRLAEILDQAGKQGLSPVTMVSAGYAREGEIEFDIADLLDLKKIGRLKPVPSGIPNSVVYVGVIGILGLCVKLAFGAFSPVVVVDNAQGPTWKEQYATAVQNTFAGATPQARFVASQLLGMFDGYESNLAGWQFDHADCRVSGPCSVKYGRMGGSFDEFAKAANVSMQPITFARDGLSLTVRGPAIPKVSGVDPKSAKDWPSQQQLTDMLLTPEQRMATAGNDLNGFGYSVQLSESQPILAAQQPANEQRVPVIRQGNWEVIGYRWQSDLLDSLPSNMRLESLTITLDQNAPAAAGGVGIKFDAKGKYYVVQ